MLYQGLFLHPDLPLGDHRYARIPDKQIFPSSSCLPERSKGPSNDHATIRHDQDKMVSVCGLFSAILGNGELNTCFLLFISPGLSVFGDFRVAGA